VIVTEGDLMTEPDPGTSIPTVEVKEEDGRSFNEDGVLESGTVSQQLLVDGEPYAPQPTETREEAPSEQSGG
jgi:hypothetical protein